jgi:uncharacterized membrane protein YsdA (DUF1294 family)
MVNMELAMPTPGSEAYLLLCLGAWMTGASAAAYVVFGMDKRRAEAGLWRVPERTLLWIAGLGGWPGAKLAQWRLHHRVRKHTFGGMLNAIALMQFILIVMAVLPSGSLIPVVQFFGSAMLGDVEVSDGKPKARVFGPKVDPNLSSGVFFKD